MRRNTTLGKIAVAVISLALGCVPPAFPQDGFQLLHEFTFGLDGAQPEGTVSVSAQGDVLYGTASGGGTYNHGIVYRLVRTSQGWSGAVLHDFGPTPDAWYPNAGVIFDKAGNMYGTSSEGGPYCCGTVYEVSPSGNGTWTEMVLHSFSIYSANSPEAPLIADQHGNLYGTLQNGGIAWGGVFEMTPSSVPGGEWSLNVIYNFEDKDDGAYPDTRLLVDGTGNLYGTSSFGGINQDTGTVYELRPTESGWVEQTLHEFTRGEDGANPSGPLTADAQGILYGVTEIAGSGACGTVYRLSHAEGAWRESTLYSFDCGVDGGHPYGELTFDQAGNLYGTTKDGGQYGYGTIFRLSPNRDGTWSESIVYSFMDSTDGANPQWGVVRDNADRMYGVTTYGGVPCGCGTMFELLPPTAPSAE